MCRESFSQITKTNSDQTTWIYELQSYEYVRQYPPYFQPLDFNNYFRNVHAFNTNPHNEESLDALHLRLLEYCRVGFELIIASVGGLPTVTTDIPELESFESEPCDIMNKVD